MTNEGRPRPLDSYTQIGDLAESVRWLLQRALLPLLILLVGETGILVIAGSRGAAAFGMISLGTLLILGLWRWWGIGLPIVPLIALQHLIAYGLPIVVDHEVLASYPPELTSKAGLEVLLFSAALAAAWRFGMGIFHPATPASYSLQAFQQDGAERLRRLGFSLIVGSTSYLLLQSVGLLDSLYALLPDGSSSVLQALVSATSFCGFFLISMFVGTRALPTLSRGVFWGLLAANGFITASGFLISATSALLASVLIGLFWSTGRMPWRYLAVVVLLLSFFNLGKFTMRERYWGADGETAVQFTLGQMPQHYAEWAQASYDALTTSGPATSVMDSRAGSPKGQSLLERINNLQNLLFVFDAMENAHVSPLGGETYTLIPPLLVPRIFWPEKPRTHEGQILLNVHFGRQDLGSTFNTYVAWGLLPEACGNFGERFGGLILGAWLGLFFAWIENLTARKLLLSLEGFIAFTVLLGMANSFEMVASVLVTSIFQSVILIVVASAPFVERTVLKRPEGPAP